MNTWEQTAVEITFGLVLVALVLWSVRRGDRHRSSGQAAMARLEAVQKRTDERLERTEAILKRQEELMARREQLQQKWEGMTEKLLAKLN